MRYSPLDAVHRRLGARMAEFGGWEMPLEYSGTIAEHLACRHSAAMFDVSHLGTVRVGGGAAFDDLQSAFTNDLGKIERGRAQYTHLLDVDGSVLDDIIIWWYAGEDGSDVFDVMPNASNTDRVVAAIGGEDVTDERAVIAVQGPEARRIAGGVVAGADAVGRFRVEVLDVADRRCVVAGTGYTGEPGVEIAVPVDIAADVWAALEAAGATPAGLGARDTLRLEAGLPLHGHELGPGITPLQAGLGWVVSWSKPGFAGREALEAERDNGLGRHLVGITTEGRRPPRQGSEILVDGVAVGEVTSGNFSPVLGHGIALGFVPVAVGAGALVEIRGRSATLEGRVVDLPFLRA